MALIAESHSGSNRRTFDIPSEGSHAATLIQLKDLGIQETRFGPKRRVRFTWRIDDERASSGGELRAFQSFNLSFDVKSHLHKAVRQILGRDPGDRYDLELLVGTRATLVIAHDDGPEGKVYANVRAVLPLREEGGRP